MRRFPGPALTLCVLAPVIAEVLSGATRVSYLVALLPEIMVWGCGALLARELALRWRAGWSSLLLLGLALAVAEEFIIQQTSIAPLPWIGLAPAYGRLWGVNWIYLLYMLGYESVWVVLIPVQLTRLLYRDRREQPWIGKRGMFISGITFLLGSYVAWFAWTQQARTVVFHAAKYTPPPGLIAAGLVAIALLVVAAWACRNADASRVIRRAPRPWQIAVGVFTLGLPWWTLIALIFIPNVLVPPPIAFAGGVLWGAFACALLRRWSSGAGWSDLHRWSAVFAGILVCMTGGFAGSSTWPPIDLAGKVAANAIAVVCLIALARKLRASSPAL